VKKLTPRQIKSEIYQICSNAMPGDIGMARTGTFFGLAIRVMTSRGQFMALTSHNFPIWEDYESGVLVTLQIGPPVAKVVTLRQYLEDVYEEGGRVAVARPDLFKSTSPSPAQMRHLVDFWLTVEGTAYDKKSIWQILKMYLKIGKKTKPNSKENVYCTEGTHAPYPEPPVSWNPDAMRGEYPAPIHYENMVRQGRVVRGAGSVEFWDMICRGR